LEFETVREFLEKMKKEFGRENKKSQKVVELKEFKKVNKLCHPSIQKNSKR